MMFRHTTHALQIKEAGLLLGDLSRPHVVHVLGLARELPTRAPLPAWSDDVEIPAAIVDYQEGRLAGNQETVDGEPHFPTVPSFVLTAAGEKMLEHQVESDESPPDDDAAVFHVPALAAHEFVYRRGVRVCLLYEDETPIADALVEVTDDHDERDEGNRCTVRTSSGGWTIAPRPASDDASLRIRLLECVENQPPAHAGPES